MSKNSIKSLPHNLVIAFATLLILSTAVVYGVIKNSPLPNQKSVAGIKEEASNPQKKQRNQSEAEYLKRQEEIKTKD
jgi:hypothetical protein